MNFEIVLQIINTIIDNLNKRKCYASITSGSAGSSTFAITLTIDSKKDLKIVLSYRKSQFVSQFYIWKVKIKNDVIVGTYNKDQHDRIIEKLSDIEAFLNISIYEGYNPQTVSSKVFTFFEEEINSLKELDE